MKANRKWILPCFLLLLVAVLLYGCYWLALDSSVYTYQSTEADICSLYLNELSSQMIAHSSSILNMKYSELKLMGASLYELHDLTEESFRRYVQRMIDYHGLSFLAFIDENGFYHSLDGAFPATTKISFLGKLLSGETNIVSYNETVQSGNVIMIGVTIEPVTYGGSRLVAAVAGFDTADYGEQLCMVSAYSGSFTSVVTKEGTYVLNNGKGVDFEGTNLLSSLAKYAQIDEDKLALLKNGLQSASTGVVNYISAGGMPYYLHFAPITGTEWFTITSMPFSVVEGTVGQLRSNMNQTFIFILIGFAAALLTIFGLFVVSNQRKRRALEQASQRTEAALYEAEKASKAKSAFLSNISHDIRTPLNGIIGFTDIAEKNSADPTRVRDCLKKIRSSSNHLLSLINDVLDMSRIESGKLELNYAPFDIRQMEDECKSIILGQMEGRGMNLEEDRSRQQATWLIGDALRLRQIIINILGNAVKFTPDGGTIRCTAESFPGGREDAVCVRFTISDTGIGMDEAFLAHLFEPFAQKDNGARTNYRGTGLGMSITKELVDAMGGEISVESTPGVGSKFSVEIPFQVDVEHVESEAGAKPCATVELSGMRVLLVEDNDINLEIAKDMLEDNGLRVTAAENGKLAVDLFAASEQGTYDFVLMDIMMPVMDGIEAAKRIRAMERADAQSVYILAMTANAFSEDARATQEAGMDEHLTKPIGEEALIAALRRHAGKPRQG